MKKLLSILSAMLLLCALPCCNSSDDGGSSYSEKSISVKHTGCAKEDSERKEAQDEDTWVKPTLQLKYSPSGLQVILENVEVNCSIKTSGMGAKQIMEGVDIYFALVLTNELKCVCPVEHIEAVVEGLKEGTTYTFHNVSFATPAFSFTYSKGLNRTIEL